MKPSRSQSPNACLASHFLLLLATTIKAAQAVPSSAVKPDSDSYQLPLPTGDDQFSAPAKPSTSGFHHAQLVKHLNPSMQVHKLSPTSNNITCNDGSQVGYYMRLNNHSKSWVIYLQGGGFCGSEESCQQRWQRSPHLMSSHFWPKTKSVDGMLSSEPKENPYLWNANHIYVPYCSSDSWTGLAQAASSGGGGSSAGGVGLADVESGGSGGGGCQGSSFAFMGSKIIERVLDSLYDDLPREFSLHEAKSILLVGESAGATGVILNLDKVASIVERRASASSLTRNNCGPFASDLIGCEQRQPPVVRGLADSGWFLDNEPYNFDRADNQQQAASAADPSSSFAGQSSGGGGPIVVDDDCDQTRCAPSQSIKQAMRLWNGQVPAACEQQHPTEPWRCYFGYKAYQTLETPLFVVQWLYDEAQLMFDRITRPSSSGQWNYVHKVANEMRASLENVTALFAPSCFAHSLVTKRIWNQININGFKLPHVLNSWEEQSLDTTNSAIASRLQLKADDEASVRASTSMASASNSMTLGAHHHPTTPQSTGGSPFQMTNENSQAHAHGGGPAAHQPPTFEALSMEQQESLQAAPQSGSPSILAPIYQRDAERSRPPPVAAIHEARQAIHRPTASSSSPSSPGTNSARSRSRKRKRNNHQRNKQARIKASLNPSSVELPTASISQQQQQQQESVAQAVPSANDLATGSASATAQELLLILDRSPSSEALFGRVPPIGSAANGRLGRSTIVDDTTLMLSNNVPDDNPANHMSMPTFEQRDSTSATRWSWPVDLRGRQITFADGFITPGSSGKPFSKDRFRLIDSCSWPQCNRDCPSIDVSVLM